MVESYCVIKEKDENFVIFGILDLGPGKGYSLSFLTPIPIFYTLINCFYQDKQ